MPTPAPEGDPIPLRERKRTQTRRAILEAVAEIELIHGGALDPSLITYARLAEIAGVSERTVYRFFPSKTELDEAYLKEQPMMLDIEMPEVWSMESWADAIEAIGIRWAERTNHLRISEHEIDADSYPASMSARRARDDQLVDQLMALLPDATAYDARQQRALTAAIHSTVSIRSLAITAQRWNLTIEEAARSHAWTLRALVHTLQTEPPEPWGDAS